MLFKCIPTVTKLHALKLTDTLVYGFGANTIVPSFHRLELLQPGYHPY